MTSAVTEARPFNAVEACTSEEVTRYLRLTLTVWQTKPSPWLPPDPELEARHRRAEQAVWKYQLQLWRKYKSPTKKLPLP